VQTPEQPHQSDADLFRPDRPGWIPENVEREWNTNPYAYQTRGQLMPGGRFYGMYLQQLAELLHPVLERSGLTLFTDIYIFYRDWEHRKQRIATSALIAPFNSSLNDEQAAYSYDLDIEPMPLCVIELTSHQTRPADARRKRLFFAALGIREYLMLDIVDQDGRLRPQIGLSLWRLQDETLLAVQPDDAGNIALECVDVYLHVAGQQIEGRTIASGEPLRTASELHAELEAQEQARRDAQERLAAEMERREAAELRADNEAEARAAAEAAAISEKRAREAAETRAAAEAEARAEMEEHLTTEAELRNSAEEKAAAEAQARADAEQQAAAVAAQTGEIPGVRHTGRQGRYPGKYGAVRIKRIQNRRSPARRPSRRLRRTS
jgi:hypothetical protein